MTAVMGDAMTVTLTMTSHRLAIFSRTFSHIGR